MATAAKVREYLAFWFQLGKPILLRGGREVILPSPVIEGGQYSSAFEDCWVRILSPESGDCYLQGTAQTIAELLSSKWDIYGCARCNMPVPMIDLGTQVNACPCADLDNWPNLDLPSPRSPISTDGQLQRIRDRLNTMKQKLSSVDD